MLLVAFVRALALNSIHSSLTRSYSNDILNRNDEKFSVSYLFGSRDAQRAGAQEHHLRQRLQPIALG